MELARQTRHLLDQYETCSKISTGIADGIIYNCFGLAQPEPGSGCNASIFLSV